MRKILITLFVCLVCSCVNSRNYHVPIYSLTDKSLLFALHQISKSECLHQGDYYVLEFFTSNLSEEECIISIRELIPFENQMDSMAVVAQLNEITFLTKTNTKHLSITNNVDSMTIPADAFSPHVGADLYLKYEVHMTQKWIRQIENKCEE